jgi:hypothetical protein
MTKEHINKMAQHLYQLHLLRFCILSHFEKGMTLKLRKIKSYNMQFGYTKIVLQELIIFVDPIDEDTQIKWEGGHFESCVIDVTYSL